MRGAAHLRTLSTSTLGTVGTFSTSTLSTFGTFSTLGTDWTVASYWVPATGFNPMLCMMNA